MPNAHFYGKIPRSGRPRTPSHGDLRRIDHYACEGEKSTNELLFPASVEVSKLTVRHDDKSGGVLRFQRMKGAPSTTIRIKKVVLSG